MEGIRRLDQESEREQEHVDEIRSVEESHLCQCEIGMERTLEVEVDYQNPTQWLLYAEIEMKHLFVNHARNVWDRIVSLLPCIDQLWYKYIHMEEMLDNVAGACQVFERWMNWEPDHHGWAAYIKFELRYNEPDVYIRRASI